MSHVATVLFEDSGKIWVEKQENGEVTIRFCTNEGGQSYCIELSHLQEVVALALAFKDEENHRTCLT